MARDGFTQSGNDVLETERVHHAFENAFVTLGFRAAPFSSASGLKPDKVLRLLRCRCIRPRIASEVHNALGLSPMSKASCGN